MYNIDAEKIAKRMHAEGGAILADVTPLCKDGGGGFALDIYWSHEQDKSGKVETVLYPEGSEEEAHDDKGHILEAYGPLGHFGNCDANILIVGTMHFIDEDGEETDEPELESVSHIIRLEEGDDPDEIGEEWLDKGYDSYCAVIEGGELHEQAKELMR